MNLLKSMCYPLDDKFTNDAVNWGLDKEKIAVAAYMEKMQELSKEFKVSKVGLVLNTEWPFLGATPYGLISCQCCGQVVLEVKCPYSCRYIPLHDYACTRESMLVPAQNTYSLKKTINITIKCNVSSLNLMPSMLILLYGHHKKSTWRQFCQTNHSLHEMHQKTRDFLYCVSYQKCLASTLQDNK